MTTQATLKTYQYYWALIKYSPRYFITDITTATIFWLSFTVDGLLLRGFFNYLTGEEGFSLSLGVVNVSMIVYTIIAGLALAGAILANTVFRQRSMALMIRNMFERILEMPGSKPLPVDQDGKTMSSGVVISTFRDDTNEIVNGITVVEDTLGLGITAIISFAILWRISPVVTLGTFAPLAIIIVIARVLLPRVERYRKRSRTATSQVTGMIADMFNGTQAIKVAHAEENIIAYFREINENRRHAMILDKVLSEIIQALSHGTVDIGLGLILFLAASLMYSGEFSIGDFALFAAYLWPMTQFMRMTGWLITLYKQSGVSFNRMEQIMQGAATGRPVTHHPIYFDGKYPNIVPQSKTEEHRLESLKVIDLTCHYGTDGEHNGGIFDVSFTLHVGTFTVITGRIGSGKSTILKALLGLLPVQKGEIYWNDMHITDPATFFVPPRCAYSGQVPRLLSDSLRNNILMGLPESDFDIDLAVQTAVLEKDIETMEKKLDTLVGPRGVRLSGGQIQRTTAARMFVRNANLLVFDDLSSALDVETESQLWNNVFSGQEQSQQPVTCLVVSHRKPVLQKADQVILLCDGKIEDVGTLKELLERSEEMRKIWYGNDRTAPSD